MYQVPYYSLIPIQNGDTATDFEASLAVPSCKTGVFNKPVSMSMRPYVKVNDTLVPSPELTTVTGLDDLHYGFNFLIQRGGSGIVFDFLIYVQATIRFIRFDGSEAETVKLEPVDVMGYKRMERKTQGRCAINSWSSNPNKEEDALCSIPEHPRL